MLCSWKSSPAPNPSITLFIFWTSQNSTCLISINQVWIMQSGDWLCPGASGLGPVSIGQNRICCPSILGCLWGLMELGVPLCLSIYNPLCCVTSYSKQLDLVLFIWGCVVCVFFFRLFEQQNYSAGSDLPKDVCLPLLEEAFVSWGISHTSIWWLAWKAQVLPSKL